MAGTAEAVIDAEIKLREEGSEHIQKDTFESLELKSKSPGYLSAVDLNALSSLLAPYEGYLRIDAKIGEYVSVDGIIANLYIGESLAEEESDKILSYFIFQDNKIETSDYRYNIEKLLEIALRAISPGINDPNTAIHCINKIGSLLGKFAVIDSYHIQKAESNQFRIYYSSYSFREDLETFYLPLIHYGREDLQVILAILKSLIAPYIQATQTNREHILKLVHHLEQKVGGSFDTELEQELFRSALAFFLG